MTAIQNQVSLKTFAKGINLHFPHIFSIRLHNMAQMKINGISDEAEVLDYKAYARNIKGFYIKWSRNPNHIFPEYRSVSGSIVSQKRINIVKKVVCSILLQEERKITRAFEELARKKYKGKKMILKVDIPSAIRRVNTAKVKRDNDYDFGEADDESMWISACKVSDEHLVGTILHEALHYIATFNGKDICEKDEHFVIKMLGDDVC